MEARVIGITVVSLGFISSFITVQPYGSIRNINLIIGLRRLQYIDSPVDSLAKFSDLTPPMVAAI